MRHFEKLRALRTFRKEHAEIFGTIEGHHLLSEIGFHQAKGDPLTLKQLFLLDIGSVSTVQRRLREFKERGLVRHQPAVGDRRSVELTLSPKCLRIFAKYDELMSSKSARRVVVPGNGQPRHMCALCDSDSGSRALLTGFLEQGQKRGDQCILVAPAEVHKDIVARLRDRRAAPRNLIVTEGYHSPDAQIAFFKRVLNEAKQAGKGVCVATNMTWTRSQNVPIDAMLEIESRVDALPAKLPIRALCVYDTRTFSSGEFLRAVKCHRDHARYPIPLG